MGNWSAASHAADKPKEDREGGIIGTGIVGTIQELGSIIVNGQRITYEPDMQVQSALGQKPASAMLPGETVVVVARPNDADWSAHSIKLHYPLVGPAVVENGGVSVLGVLLDLGAMDAPDIKSGDWVAVSGLWQENRVMVSSINQVTSERAAVISGSYTPSGQESGFSIGSAEISGIVPQHVSFGEIITVTGTPQPNGLEATRLRVGLFDDPMDSIIVEGYMSAPTSDGLYTILGSGALAYTTTPSMIDTQVSGIYCVRPGSGESTSAITPMEADCR